MEGVLAVRAAAASATALVSPKLKANEAQQAIVSEQSRASTVSEIRASEQELVEAQLVNTTGEEEAKLFNAGTLPIKGLFDVQLSDDNGDGRVDAGDAISEYMLIARQVDDAPSSKKALDRLV
ncbi:MAG: hypothetical protein KDD42_09280 [Bdellovibrionales bacterium]|nr:hypothetical protein [Bdellovibrionales bacterium]